MLFLRTRDGSSGSKTSTRQKDKKSEVHSGTRHGKSQHIAIFVLRRVVGSPYCESLWGSYDEWAFSCCMCRFFLQPSHATVLTECFGTLQKKKVTLFCVALLLNLAIVRGRTLVGCGPLALSGEWACFVMARFTRRS